MTEGDQKYDTELEKVAQRLLAPRDHAVFEFKSKLRKRGWLDDQRFADRQAELLARDPVGWADGAKRGNPTKKHQYKSTKNDPVGWVDGAQRRNPTNNTHHH